MQKMTTRSCMITCAIIAALTAGAIAGIDSFGRSSRVAGRTGTIQSQHIVKQLVNDPRDAYWSWKKAGYRGRTVVYVSARWESFDPGELIPIRMFRAYPLELYNTARLLEDDSLNGMTFLYVATVNKISRKIVAIVPENEVDRMKEAARRAKDSRVSDKGVYISRQGFPRWFTTGANFADVGEPVLLYVGASYFKNAEPEELYRQLSSSGLQTDCVILCNETGKDSVTPDETTKLTRFARLIGMTTSVSGSGGRVMSGTDQQQRAARLHER
jgi:hypothetical protein